MHLVVVKVGLLRLAKTEVFCQRIIVTKKASMKDIISSNFDNPYTILASKYTKINMYSIKLEISYLKLFYNDFIISTKSRVP